jgi:hypothetical protein
MFSFLGSIAKAAVGVVVLPVAAVADIVTLGRTVTDDGEPYTSKAVGDILNNLSDATSPDSKGNS